MKKLAIIFSITVLMTTIAFGRVHIILFDCSGSFIGPNVPEMLKNGSLIKINEIISNATYNDTIIFFAITSNSTVSSLNQILLVKAKAKTVFDPTINKKNEELIKNFVKRVLKEINKPYSNHTDITSAVNYAAAIAKNYRDATVYNFSDGKDNISAKLFKRLDNISIYHLFIFDNNSTMQNRLLVKWERLYKELGAKSVVVKDAQASMTTNIGLR